MRRALVVLLGLLVAPSVFAAARTASVNGAWNATATWGGAAVPTNADDCTINANITVYCDLSPCLCGSLTVSGHTFATGTNYYRIGDGASGGLTDSITINSGGEVKVGAGQKIEFDTLSVAGGGGTPTGAQLTVNSGGTLTVVGRMLRTDGAVSSFAEPSGTSTAGTQTITDSTLRQDTLDQYAGKILMPTTGMHRWQPFTITTGAANRSEIVLLAFTRGAYDSRLLASDRFQATAWAPGDWGEIVSAGTVTTNGTTTVTGAGTSWTAANAVGGLFGCRADLDVQNDPDLRNIVSVTDATHIVLDAVPTATCNGGGANYNIFDRNQPGVGALKIVQAFSEGDRYVIFDPAVITVVAGNQSETSQLGNWYGTYNNGSTTTFKMAELGWCGQRLTNGAGGSLTSRDCISINQIDNSLTTEQFTFEYVDVHHFNGSRGMEITDSPHLRFRKFALRDAAEGGANDGGEAHGTSIQDLSGNGRVTDIIFEDFRIVRANDDAFTWTQETEAADNVLCDGCKIRRGVVGFAPSNGGGSVELFEPGKSLTNFEITDNLFTNYENAIISWSAMTDTATDVESALVAFNVLANSQLGGLASAGTNDTGDPTNANWRVAFVSNYLQGGTAANRGTWYSNYVDIGVSGIGSASFLGLPQGLYGNIFLQGPTPAANGAVWSHEPGATNALSPATLTVRDNVCVANFTMTAANSEFCFRAGGTSSSSNITIDHNTFWGDQAYAGANFVKNAVRTNAPSDKTHTFTNNLFANWNQGPHKSAGTHTVTSDYNAFWRVNTPCGGCSTGANDISTGVTSGLLDPFNGDFNIATGTTPWTSLGSDGYPRGARVAGPTNWGRLLAVYPFLPVRTGVNVIGDVDTDGDGIWNLHDNCDTKWNPTQTDTDADGAGDACDP